MLGHDVDIVGDDTIVRSDGKTYKDEFLKGIVADRIKDRIVFHGRVEEDELRDFYRNCDLFVAPSRYESFGLVYLEAMMFGKAVIGCDAGGIPEVVTHGVTGLLAKPGDPDSLRDALQTLLQDNRLRLEMGKAARADYKSRFTDISMRDKMIGMIRFLSGQGGHALAQNAITGRSGPLYGSGQIGHSRSQGAQAQHSSHQAAK